jgi:GMP synthase-like glutamine amidotransferase
VSGKIRLGVLETGAPPGRLREPFGTYPEMFQRLLGETDFAYESFDVQHGALPASVEAAQGYIVTGSPSGAYDADPWIADLRGFLRAAKGRAVLVGVCFGHQIMADAFGGTVIKSPKGWGIGLHDYALRGPEPWMTPGPLISVPASHQDQVVALPPAARVIGSSAFSEMGMLAYDDQPAISIQLHPEFDPAYAKALIEGRRERYPEGLADEALASLDRPNDNQRVGEWIAAFLRERAAQP